LRCPFCNENNEESISFPANNLKQSGTIVGFLDEHGVKVEPKSVALEYGCTQGHVFRLEDITKLNEQTMPVMPESIHVP